MPSKQIQALLNRFIEGRCPICDCEIKDKEGKPTVPIVSEYLSGLTVDICARHPRP